MKKKNNKTLQIPINFQIACTLCKICPVEVLQTFIDHTNFYNLFDDTYDEGYWEVMTSIRIYISGKSGRLRESKAIRKCASTFDLCIGQLSMIADKVNNQLSMATKREYARHAINAIFEEMEQPHTALNAVYLDEFTSLKLTKDFCILCEVYNCYPKEYLEFFMGVISLSHAHAHIGLNLKYDMPSFIFFMKVVNGSFGNHRPPSILTETEEEFREIMAEIPLKIYHIRNVERRHELLCEAYYQQYEKLTKN
ncbi:hypothetical protein OQY15_09690 [Pedobacter sp. MC2016-15]|uniref:hypothetical protein n=1 Tax=Pedobacter sp. MC2016-15 TaxID=2994473 RepID=UPI0022465C8A|nr:hypothetical protein [Pedobacter sp. MC2016-15]MCX2479361.1 hypothetical protein [Pedobacter sp. MC2016-15]